MQAIDATLKEHYRDPTTALTHGTGSFERRRRTFKRQNDFTGEFVDAPARGTVDPDL